MIRRRPGDSYVERYHLIRKDGSRILVEDRGRIVRTDEGRAASVSINVVLPEDEGA